MIMRYTSSNHLFFPFVAGLLVSTSAYSNGAGQCLVGVPSVSGSHLSQPTVKTGILLQGRYSMRILSSFLTHDTLLTVGGNDSFDIPLEISGPPFKGILVNVDGMSDDEVFPGSGLKYADNCPDQTAITHQDSSSKSKAEVAISVGKEASTRIDVTVVVQNSNGVSEYYHSNFKLETISRDIYEFNDDCMARLLDADEDGDFMLTRDEYYTFIGLMGQERCYTPGGALTEQQSETFKQFGCSYCVSVNEPLFCCLNPTSFSIAGADSYNDATSIQKSSLQTVCQYTNADIPPSCDRDTPQESQIMLSPSNPTKAPSGSPVRSPTLVSLDAEIDLSATLPSDLPSLAPSDLPSMAPSDLPSMVPSDLPSMVSILPSVASSDLPSVTPSGTPPKTPTLVAPTKAPATPSTAPSGMPFATHKVTLDAPSDF